MCSDSKRADDHHHHADPVAHILKCHVVGFSFLPLKLVQNQESDRKKKEVQGALPSSNGIHNSVLIHIEVTGT